MHMCSASTITPTPRGCSSASQPVSCLPGESLLYLRSAGEHLDDASKLGQAEDAPAGEIADVRDAHERQHVVLAHRLHRNGPRKHQLVVGLVVGERREVERSWARASRRRRGPSGAVSCAVDSVSRPTPSARQERGRSLLGRGQVDALGTDLGVDMRAGHHAKRMRRDTGALGAAVIGRRLVRRARLPPRCKRLYRAR